MRAGRTRAANVESTLPFLPPYSSRLFRTLSVVRPSSLLGSRARLRSLGPAPRQRRRRALLSRSVRRAASPFHTPVPFDDLSLPPALFSSLSPDKRQHAALAQLPVVTSSARRTGQIRRKYPASRRRLLSVLPPTNDDHSALNTIDRSDDTSSARTLSESSEICAAGGHRE